MHTLPYPAPNMSTFDASRSIATTPTPTPPASRGTHNAMSYNPSAFAPPNGYHSQQSTPRAYGDVNGAVPTQYLPGQQPQIYTV